MFTIQVPTLHEMTSPSIIVGAVLALELFSGMICAGAALPDTVQCPLTVLHGRLYVRAALRGSHLYSFMIDTGAHQTVIDWKIKETNQIPVRPGGAFDFPLNEGRVMEAMGDLQIFKLGSSC